MKALAFRINRTTYAVTMGLFVAIVAAVMTTFGKAGPSEVIAAFIVIPRLHDIGRSGWCYAPLILGSVVAALIGLKMGGIDGGQIAAGVYVLVVLALCWLLAFVPGQTDANKWGDPPEPGMNWKRPAMAKQKYRQTL